MLQAALIGALVGLAVSGVGATAHHRGRPSLAALEVVSGAALLTTGLVVATGVLSGSAGASAGATLSVSGLLILSGHIRRRFRRHSPNYWATPVLIVTVPLAIASITAAGAYGPLEIQVVLGALGFAAAIASCVAVYYVARTSRSIELDSHAKFVVAIGLLIGVVAGWWALSTSTASSGFGFILIPPFVAMALLVTFGVSRWLRGQRVSPVVAGAVLIAAAVIAYGTGVLGTQSFFAANEAMSPLIWSCLALGVGGLVFAIAVSAPPTPTSTA